ncbi:MAG: hypothetical protein ACYC46_08385 [Acidobacteriaceae bacterium]
MARNFYTLAATLLLFSLISCGVAWTNIAHQPASPGDAALWRMIGLLLLLLALVMAVVGMFTSMFEQTRRRNETQAERDHRRGM